MTALLLPFAATAADALATAPAAARWLRHVRRLRVQGDFELVTGDAETCCILLAGTFDLVGGGTAWPSRGARPAPTAGRPVAVFLPPRTPFAAQRGTGELLLFAAARSGATATGLAALQQSPLLRLAGSGKSFDPGSGEWRPAETFPDAPESLPPRRIERRALGAATVERVFAADYKATSLCVDELVVPPQTTLDLTELGLPAAAHECLVYVRTDDALLLTAAGAPPLRCSGEAVVFAATPATTLRIANGAAAAYLGIAHGGK